MNITNILVGICSLLFLMIGVDKFLGYLDPPCSMEASISPIVWKALGVVQIASAFLLWSPKYRKHIAGFFMVFMLVFTAVHLSQNTKDIGGSLFLAVLLGILVWNPSFIRGKTQAT